MRFTLFYFTDCSLKDPGWSSGLGRLQALMAASARLSFRPPRDFTETSICASHLISGLRLSLFNVPFKRKLILKFLCLFVFSLGT